MKRPPPPAPRAPRRNLAVLSACQSANRFTSSQHEVNHIKGASPGGADAKGLGGGVSKGEAGSRSAYQPPVFCIDAQGSFGGSDSPSCRSEEHTSELQSLMRISNAVFCLTNNNITRTINN